MEITTYFSNKFRRDFAIRTGNAAPVLMRQSINPAELSERLRERLIGNQLELPSRFSYIRPDGSVESYAGTSGLKGILDGGELDVEGRYSGWLGGKFQIAWPLFWDHFDEPEAQITAADFEELFWATDATRIESQRRAQAAECEKRLASALEHLTQLKSEIQSLKAGSAALRTALTEIGKLNDAGGPGSRRKVREIIAAQA